MVTHNPIIVVLIATVLIQHSNSISLVDDNGLKVSADIKGGDKVLSKVKDTINSFGKINPIQGEDKDINNKGIGLKDNPFKKAIDNISNGKNVNAKDSDLSNSSKDNEIPISDDGAKEAKENDNQSDDNPRKVIKKKKDPVKDAKDKKTNKTNSESSDSSVIDISSKDTPSKDSKGIVKDNKVSKIPETDSKDTNTPVTSASPKGGSTKDSKVPLKDTKGNNTPAGYSSNNNVPTAIRSGEDAPVKDAKNIKIPVKDTKDIKLPVKDTKDIKLPVKDTKKTNSQPETTSNSGNKDAPIKNNSKVAIKELSKTDVPKDNEKYNSPFNKADKDKFYKYVKDTVQEWDPKFLQKFEDEYNDAYLDASKLINAKEDDEYYNRVKTQLNAYLKKDKDLIRKYKVKFFDDFGKDYDVISKNLGDKWKLDLDVKLKDKLNNVQNKVKNDIKLLKGKDLNKWKQDYKGNQGKEYVKAFLEKQYEFDKLYDGKYNELVEKETKAFEKQEKNKWDIESNEYKLKHILDNEVKPKGSEAIAKADGLHDIYNKYSKYSKVVKDKEEIIKHNRIENLLFEWEKEHFGKWDNQYKDYIKNKFINEVLEEDTTNKPSGNSRNALTQDSAYISEKAYHVELDAPEKEQLLNELNNEVRKVTQLKIKEKLLRERKEQLEKQQRLKELAEREEKLKSKQLKELKELEEEKERVKENYIKKLKEKQHNKPKKEKELSDQYKRELNEKMLKEAKLKAEHDKQLLEHHKREKEIAQEFERKAKENKEKEAKEMIENQKKFEQEQDELNKELVKLPKDNNQTSKKGHNPKKEENSNKVPSKNEKSVKPKMKKVAVVYTKIIEVPEEPTKVY